MPARAGDRAPGVDGRGFPSGENLRCGENCDRAAGRQHRPRRRTDPRRERNAIVLSLTAHETIREIDALNDTMVVEAGVTLAEAQAAAESVDRLFPLALASEGTAHYRRRAFDQRGRRRGARLWQRARPRDRASRRSSPTARWSTRSPSCAKTIPGTISKACSSAPRARWASSPPRR